MNGSSAPKARCYMRPSCTSCDMQGPETRIGMGYTLQECMEACLQRSDCHAIDFGKNGRAGECYVNDGGTKGGGHNNFDGWAKSCEAQPCTASEAVAAGCGDAGVCGRALWGCFKTEHHGTGCAYTHSGCCGPSDFCKDCIANGGAFHPQAGSHTNAGGCITTTTTTTVKATSYCGAWPSTLTYGCTSSGLSWKWLLGTSLETCAESCSLQVNIVGSLCCYYRGDVGCYMKPGAQSKHGPGGDGMTMMCQATISSTAVPTTIP